MLHMKKEQKWPFRKNSAKNHAKAQIQLYIYLLEKNHQKVTLKQKNTPCFNVGSFGKGTAISLLAKKV